MEQQQQPLHRLEETVTITADNSSFLSQQVLYSSHIVDFLNTYASAWSWQYAEEVTEKSNNSLLKKDVVDMCKRSYPQIFDVINLEHFDTKTTTSTITTSIQINKLQSTTQHVQLKNIHIQSVDLFNKNVGFVKFKTTIVNRKDQTPIPGIVFSRGHSVSMIVVVNDKWVVTKSEFRVPAMCHVHETCAGMIDSEDLTTLQIGRKEIIEELGIDSNVKFKQVERFSSDLFLSIGGSTEKLTTFLVNIELSDVSKLIGSIAGNSSENEKTYPHVHCINEFIKTYGSVLKNTKSTNSPIDCKLILAAVALKEKYGYDDGTPFYNECVWTKNKELFYGLFTLTSAVLCYTLMNKL